MSTDTTPQAHDSSEDIVLPTNGFPEETHSERMRRESDNIFRLVLGKTSAITSELMINEFGTLKLTSALSEAPYQNIMEIFNDLVSAVTVLFTKIAMLDNMSTDVTTHAVNVQADEISRTIRELFNEAFMDHGKTLRGKIANIRNARPSEKDSVRR